jgi:hypothetical protein
VGETEEAEELFQSWLAADPRWRLRLDWLGGLPRVRADRPKNYGRAEELLRRGFSTPGVRDRDAIAGRLQIVCQEQDAAARPKNSGSRPGG